MSPESEASIGAVVLNYMDSTSTLRCAESLLDCRPPPNHIVVVDNDSPNDSYETLSAALGAIDRVEVLASGHNGGYSFGNNVGIRRLLALGADHVVIATSDTTVLSKDLFAQLAAVIGSDVGAVGTRILGAAEDQNPSAERITLKYIADIGWIQMGMPGLNARRRLRRLIKPGVTTDAAVAKSDIERRAADTKATPTCRSVFKLHGAFICLTAEYLERVGLLDERIFMYGEEDLIAWHCHVAGLEQRLLTSAEIHHADNSSVSLAKGSSAQRFVDTHQRNSGRIIRDVVRKSTLLNSWAARKFRG